MYLGTSMKVSKQKWQIFIQEFTPFFEVWYKIVSAYFAQMYFESKNTKSYTEKVLLFNSYVVKESPVWL